MATHDSQATAAERILAVAERLFGEAGYKGASVGAVAREAGVSKANIFHHFGSKEELYLAVLRNARRRLTDQLGKLAARPDAPLDETLRQIADAYLGDLLSHADLARLFIRELLDRGPLKEQVLAERIFEPNFSRLLELLDDARAKRQIRDGVDPAVAVTLLVAACVFFFQGREVLRHLPDTRFAEDSGDFSRMMVDILMNGITPR